MFDEKRQESFALTSFFLVKKDYIFGAPSATLAATSLAAAAPSASLAS